MVDKMTPEQESHLSSIRLSFGVALDDKYRAGQTEHGGDLWTKPQADNIIEEAVDMVAYSLTLRAQLRAMREAAVDGDLEKLRALALQYC